MRTHHSSPVEVALAANSSKSRIEAGMPSARVVGLAGQTQRMWLQTYSLLPDTGLSQLWSTFESVCVVPRTHDSFRRQKFLCCRLSCVERLALVPLSRQELQTFGEVTKRTYVWAATDRGAL